MYTGNTVITIIIFCCYLLVMVGIGVYFFRKNKNISDYVLGGRSLNPWVAAMSAQASDMSGWLLMGLPGLAYVLFAGTTEAIWTAIGLAVGTYLNWLIVAKRLRKYTAVSGNSITLPEFFQNRFRDTSGLIKGISAIFILIFFLFYTASMFQAGAKLFQTVFGLDYTLALLIGVVIIVSYTFLGGFLAVCWTDTIQGVLMFIALVVTPIIAFVTLGGGAEVGAKLSALASSEFSFLPVAEGGGINVMLLVSALAWGLGYFGQPHILPRFMGIKHPNQIRPARIIATSWVVITLAAAVIVGILGSALLPGLTDSETVFISLSTQLFPPVIAGILLTAILAAIMSTADSQLLVTSSAISNDLYGGLIKKGKEVKPKKLLWISRITVVVVAVLAALLVAFPDAPPDSIMGRVTASVFDLVSFAWGGFGAAFGPIVLFSLFWRRTTKWGALFGIIAGGVTCAIWWLLQGGIFEIYEIIPGFIVSSLVIVVVSLLTKVPAEVEQEFDSVATAEF